jgi:hypothetical protein
VVGREDLVAQTRGSPADAALRVDKMTYAALEATLQLWTETSHGSRFRSPACWLRRGPRSKPRTGDRPCAVEGARASRAGHRRRFHDWRRKRAGFDLPTALLELSQAACRRRHWPQAPQRHASRDCTD